MRWTNDDEIVSSGLDDSIYIPDYPAELEVMGFFQDPLLSAELDTWIDEAELMGIDLDDPELMGGFIKNIIKKIKERRAKRKAAGEAAPEIPTVNIQTGQGVAQIGPGGVTWTDPATGKPSTTTSALPGGIAEMIKNPWVIGGGAAALLLIIMMMSRRNR